MASRAPTLVPMGAFLMAIVTEGTSPMMRATMGQVFTWIGRAMAPYTMTLDSVAPQPPMEMFFGMPRDTFITVDLSDMRIVDIRRADAAGALNNLEMLLTASRDP